MRGAAFLTNTPPPTPPPTAGQTRRTLVTGLAELADYSSLTKRLLEPRPPHGIRLGAHRDALRGRILRSVGWLTSSRATSSPPAFVQSGVAQIRARTRTFLARADVHLGQSNAGDLFGEGANECVC